MKSTALILTVAASYFGVLNAQTQTFEDATELTTSDLVVKDGEIVDVIIPTAMNNALKSSKKHKHNHHHRKREDNNMSKDDQLEKLADKLIHDFTITFNESNDNDNDNNKNNRTASASTKKHKHKSQNLDKQIEGWTKKVFSRPKKQRRNKTGQPVKYYKDNSIPIMFRKVIPPSGQKLPLLHFKYHENGKLCNCKCKV